MSRIPRAVLAPLLALALLLGAPLAAAAAAGTAAPLGDAAGPRLIAEQLRPLGADVTPPKFPDAYELEWEFSMPYFLALQPSGFKYKVHAWVDRAADSVRVDFDGGEQQAFFVGRDEYALFPRKYERVCLEYRHGGGPVAAARPHAVGAGPAGLLGTPLLPDLSADGWAPAGAAVVGGVEAVQWRLRRRHEAGNKMDDYTFLVTKEGVPLQLHSIGVDLFEESHYDEYIYDFTAFRPGPVDPKAFEIPKGCPPPKARAERPAAGLHAQALLPGALLADRDRAHYAAFSREFGREHYGAADYAARLEAFAANKARVAAHNAAAARGGPGAPRHRLALNRFADWPRDELDRALLPKKWRRERGLDAAWPKAPEAEPVEVFKGTLSKGDLPEAFDWRGTPADYAVKDQAQCGSCWAFAATGAMEGAWFVATGSGRSFSDQQLIDCAWDEGPNGCDGGDAQPAFRYVAKAGGIAATADYEYRGLNGFCRDNATRLEGHFRGYGQVPRRDEAAVMEALMRHGPLAVGVDAGHDFIFYSDGVYYERRCELKPKRLDHAVLLVGWGSTPEGEEFWVVRNSWSKFWGNDGYVFISRRGNDCGIASDAVYAKVEDKYVVEGAAERARKMAAAATAAGCAATSAGAGLAAMRPHQA